MELSEDDEVIEDDETDTPTVTVLLEEINEDVDPIDFITADDNCIATDPAPAPGSRTTIEPVDDSDSTEVLDEVISAGSDENIKDTEEVEEIIVPSINEAVEAMKVVRAYRNYDNFIAHSDIDRLQYASENRRSQLRKQKLITDYFNTD